MSRLDFVDDNIKRAKTKKKVKQKREPWNDPLKDSRKLGRGQIEFRDNKWYIEDVEIINIVATQITQDYSGMTADLKVVLTNTVPLTRRTIYSLGQDGPVGFVQ